MQNSSPHAAVCIGLLQWRGLGLGVEVAAVWPRGGLGEDARALQGRPALAGVRVPGRLAGLAVLAAAAGWGLPCSTTPLSAQACPHSMSAGAWCGAAC